MATLSDRERGVLEEPNFAHLGTLTEDGYPHVSPVWVSLEGDLIVVNTAEGREKIENIRRDPRVGVSVHQQSNPYNNVTVRGRVVEVTHEGADENVDALSKKYLGQDPYPFRQPGEQRVVVRIRPETVKSLFVD